MRRPRFGGRSSTARDTEELIRLARGLGDSGSRSEDHYWETNLVQAIDGLLAAADDSTLEAALDALQAQGGRAYDALADLIESRAESGILRDGQNTYSVLLVAAPVLAWSRYAIPSGTMPKALLNNLKVHWQAHLLSKTCQFAMADLLYSPDQLPAGYCDTSALVRRLGLAALADRDVNISTEGLPETQPFISDIRYLLGAVVVKQGEPFFRWQEDENDRQKLLSDWRSQGGPNLSALLMGCSFEPLLPDAYHAAWRMADRQGRPFAVKASVTFLQANAGIEPQQMRAIVAPYHGHQLEEYRVSFARRTNNEVLHGVVWPLLGNEDENGDTVDTIVATLREAGIEDIIQLDHRFPLEYCDDCGAPMFANPEGESVHAEMPEEVEEAPRHLH